MESPLSEAQISIHALYCTVNLLIVHQIQHVIVKYAHKSLLHRLKNNLSQEDTWHDNCVWWRDAGMLKASPAWESSQHRLPFQSQRKPMARCTHRGYLRELASDPITHTPDHIPLCVLSSARPSNLRTVPSALKCEPCIDYSIPQLSIAATLRCSIGLQLYHAYKILYIFSKHWDHVGFLIQKYKGNHHHHNSHLKSPLSRDSEVVLTLASLLPLFSLWPH